MKRTFYVLIFTLIGLQSVMAQCYCEDCPELIINGAPSTASLNVSGATNNILGQNGQSLINVGVHFSHTAAQELSLRLVAPDGSFVDLTIGEGLDVGQNNIFDIDFVQCGDTATPDCTNNATWTSTDEWNQGPYSGSYFPESGCLEDLTGDVNGTWTLELEDVFVAFDGELFCFDIAFADASGISCNNAPCDAIVCLAQGGNNTTPALVTALEGDPSLIIDYTVFYDDCEIPPSEPEYVFVYVVHEPFPGTIVEIVEGDVVDMTAYPEGTYIVQGLSILASDLPTILALDFSTTTYFDLSQLFQNGTICADNTTIASQVIIEDDCLANAGILSVFTIDVCIGDPSLNLDLTPSYPTGDEPDDQYSYTYVISESGVITSYSMSTDFTSYPAGEYEVCGLSYLTLDESLIPAANGSYSLGDLQNDIDNDLFCGDLSEECLAMIINEIPSPIFTGPTEVCAGELVQYVVENFSGDNADYVFFIQSGGFSTLNNNMDGTFDITWSSGPGVICLTETSSGCSDQVCITVNVNPQPEIMISGVFALCPGDELIYTFDPAPVGGQFYDVSVTGGIITNQTSNTVTILWDDSGDGTILVSLIGGECDSEPILQEVVKIEVEFPPLAIPTEMCLNESLSFQDIDPPDVVDWIWTATNADIDIDFFGVITFTWLDIGPAEICLEIFTDCGQEQQCFPINVLQSPEPSTEQLDLVTCSFNFTLEGIPSNGTSWMWSAPGLENCVIFSNPTDLVTQVTATCGPGVYWILIEEWSDDCHGQFHFPVTVAEGMDISEPSFECDSDGFYTVSFTIANGTEPYAVNGNTIGSDVFTSAPIASGSPYSFTVVDDLGCEEILEGTYTCPCITFAGTMVLDPLVGCISSGDELEGMHNTDHVFDFNDVGTYILHTSADGSLGTILGENNTGIFGFDPLTMIPGEVYYISFIAGDPLNDGVDLSDPCLSVSVGQPIMFINDPEVDAGEDDTSCDFIYDLTLNANTAGGIWSVIDQPDGSTVDFQVIGVETTATVDMVGIYTFELDFNDNGCSGTDQVTITFLESPMFSFLSTVCAGDFYTVSFDISGGIEPYFVNGVEIANNAYTSAPIMSGENYSFIILDANGCSSDLIEGTEVCNCITDAGTMSQEEITICAIDGELIAGIFNDDATFDGNDGGVFVLHTGSSNILGTILDTNDVPEFIYNANYGIDVTLYLSYVVANEVADTIDFEDDCLSVAVGQPVNIDPLLQVDAGNYEDQCSFAFDLNADDQGVAGGWIIIESPVGANIIFSNSMNAQSSFTTDLSGDYSIAWQPQDDKCVVSDTTTFTLAPELIVETQIIDCADDLQSYNVSIEISGGEAPYYINGDEISANFDLPPTISGTAYNYTLIDSRGCELIIEGMVTCECTNVGGSMALDTLIGCIQDTLVAVYNEDAILDSDDVQFFVLHTSATDTLGAVLSISTEPNVIFLPGMIAGNVYYVSHIIGNAAGSGLNYTDPCLKISPGQPIIFNASPEVDAGEDQEVCGLTTSMDGFSSSLSFNWTVIETPFGGLVTIDDTDLKSLIIVTIPGDYILALEADNGYCSEFDTVTISFIEGIIFEDVNVDCLIDGYTIAFTISGGTAPYFVDGTEAVGNSFVSSLIPSGQPFNFVVEDSGGCAEILVSGFDTCACENDAGTMQEDLIELCIDEYFDINALTNDDVILDNDDIRYMVIHTSPTNELGDIIDMVLYNNGINEWEFQYSPFVVGVTYYVSTVLANEGALDGTIEDPCISVAPGTPIVWRDYYSFSFNDDITACLGDTLLIDISASGQFPFEVLISDDLGFNEIVLIDQANDAFEYVVSDEAILSLDFISNAPCFTIDKGDLTIQVDELPMAELRESVSICNSEEFGSIVYFDDLFISGYTDGQWIFDSSAIQGSFDFNGFAAGEYFLEYLIESELCSTSEVYQVLVVVTECDCPIFDYNSLDVTCFGDEDGVISILIADGLNIADYTVFLNGEEVDSNTEIDNLKPNTYLLEISDGIDCIASF